MNIQPFIEDPRVVRAIARLEADCAGKFFSEIVDGEGHQYVDLVLEGGGVLGIALTGYTYALEQMGLRFLRIGGTSVGAINALLIAAIAPPAESKTAKLLPHLADLPIDSFVDGSQAVRRFIDCWRRGFSWRTVLRGVPVVHRFWQRLGLCQGKQLTGWLTSILHSEGIQTVADLKARMNQLPEGLSYRDGQPLSDVDRATCLKLVAADVTTETKAIFPEMAHLYFHDPETINPALFVRASMSVPYLFKPLRLRKLPSSPEIIEYWRRKGYQGEVPEEVLFVDGGIMSNFPIDLFHNDGVPAAPTFGVKLGFDRQRARPIGTPLQLHWAIFDAARRCGDFDFIQNNPDYHLVVQHIDTGAYHWLDFELTREAQIDLFAAGVEAAAKFLHAFDWQRYKEVRKDMNHAWELQGGGHDPPESAP